MSDTQVTTSPSRADVDRLAAAFNHCFETFQATDDLFTPDALFDLLPPLWRFQLQGPDAFAEQLRTVADGGRVSARVLRAAATSDGFVMEHEEISHDTNESARRLWLCQVTDGRISEAVGYCNGGWDDELRARHAAEAPMLRP